MARQHRSTRPSQSLSAARPSPLLSLGSFPLTATSFSSSPTLSSISAEMDSSLPGTPRRVAEETSQSSPKDLLSDDYTVEMEESVRLVEGADEDRRRNNLPPLFLCDGVPVDDDSMSPLPSQVQDEKHWVVFIGKVPGVYPLL